MQTGMEKRAPLRTCPEPWAEAHTEAAAVRSWHVLYNLRKLHDAHTADRPTWAMQMWVGFFVFVFPSVLQKRKKNHFAHFKQRHKMAVEKSILLPLGFPENGRSVTFQMTEGEDSTRLNVGKRRGLACSAPRLTSELCPVTKLSIWHMSSH